MVFLNIAQLLARLQYIGTDISLDLTFRDKVGMRIPWNTDVWSLRLWYSYFLCLGGADLLILLLAQLIYA